MKKGMSMKVGTAGKKMASGKHEMRVTTGRGFVASTGAKRPAAQGKHDQRQTRA